MLPDVKKTLNWGCLASRVAVRVRFEERDGERPLRMGTTAVVTIRGFPDRAARAAHAAASR